MIRGPRHRVPHQRRASGNVRALSWPHTGLNLPGGAGIRVDTAAYQDGVIPPYYDSLVAKLIAYGDARGSHREDETRARHVRGRGNLYVDPVAPKNSGASGFRGGEDRYGISGADRNPRGEEVNLARLWAAYFTFTASSSRACKGSAFLACEETLGMTIVDMVATCGHTLCPRSIALKSDPQLRPCRGGDSFQRLRRRPTAAAFQPRDH